MASVNMPWGGVDGLVDYLRDESHQRLGSSVILTGCTADGNVAELQEEPCVFRYLRKPFLMGRLLDCIRAIESDVVGEGCMNLSTQPRPVAVACH